MKFEINNTNNDAEKLIFEKKKKDRNLGVINLAIQGFLWRIEDFPIIHLARF